jgi:hypothetical protein
VSRLHSSKQPKTQPPAIPARNRTFSEEDCARAIRRLEQLSRKREFQLRHPPWRRGKRWQ